jgi:hypothetical protein
MALPRAVVLVFADRVELISPYVPEMIESLKYHVPWGRTWSPEEKIWRVQRQFLADLMAAIDPFMDYMVFDGKRQWDGQSRSHSEWFWEGERKAPPPPPRPGYGGGRNADLYALLHLIPGAPIEVVKAAYRAVALKAHPDTGGSDAQMKVINAAYEKLMADLKVT